MRGGLGWSLPTRRLPLCAQHIVGWDNGRLVHSSPHLIGLGVGSLAVASPAGWAEPHAQMNRLQSLERIWRRFCGRVREGVSGDVLTARSELARMGVVIAIRNNPYRRRGLAPSVNGKSLPHGCTNNQIASALPEVRAPAGRGAGPRLTIARQRSIHIQLKRTTVTTSARKTTCTARKNREG